MIALVYPFFFVSLTGGRPSKKKRYKYETFLPIASENIWRKSGFKFLESHDYKAKVNRPRLKSSQAQLLSYVFGKLLAIMKNSSTKLIVPCELILAEVEEKKMVEIFDMVLTNI